MQGWLVSWCLTALTVIQSIGLEGVCWLRQAEMLSAFDGIKGRFLGSLIKEGMAEKDARKLLGVEPNSHSIRYAVGVNADGIFGSRTELYCYDSLHLDVTFRGVKVHEVRFTPLLRFRLSKFP